MTMPAPPPRGRPEAIVRPATHEQPFCVERVAPRAELAEVVDYHWLVRWDVRGTHRQQVVPQPRVHVAAEQGRLLVHGISRQPFQRVLEGRGVVAGTAFRPAGFRALLRSPVRDITGSVRPGQEILGLPDAATAERILQGGSSAELVEQLEGYLLAASPEVDDTGRWVDRLVEEAERRRQIRRADDLAALAGVSLRSLQRLFGEYVGIGPKWVIQRFRILEAAAAALDHPAVDWAGLAHDLGFSDQAHLTRRFAEVVGTPPATYRRPPRL